MKARITLLCAVLWLGLLVRSSSAATWALLVGVSEYQNPRITSLKYPAADVTSIRDALVDPQLGALPAANVKLLTNKDATSTNILGAVDTFLKPKVKAGDQVIVFLAGHGIAKGFGADAKGYFLSTDVTGVLTPALDASAVPLKTLSAKLSELPAGQFVMFVDACREDPTPGRGLKPNQLSDVMSRGFQIDVPEGRKQPQVVTFFACSIGQRAYEDPKLQHGVFTYSILDALKKGPVVSAPDNHVDMGVLSSQVIKNVKGWAHTTSGGGRGATIATQNVAAADEDEVQQTPEIIGTDVTAPVVLMKVKRKIVQPAVQPPAGSVLVTVVPEGAAISLNGATVGVAPVIVALPKTGMATIKAEAPGYEAVEKQVKGLNGYQVQITLPLLPAARGVTAPADDKAAQLFKQALAAETSRQWEVALAGYDAVRDVDPKFAPAYEREAYLQQLRGSKPQAVTTLTVLVAQVPTARSYSLLARAYAELAVADMSAASLTTAPAVDKDDKKGGLFGKGKKKKKDDDKNKKDTPAAPAIPANALQALRMADAAVKQDAGSAEAHLARGYALVAADQGGKNKDEAAKEFGKAVLLDGKNAETQLGLGYGIRNFSMLLPEGPLRKAELDRAIVPLKQALALRPDFYEAHRELAYCYHLQGDTDNAIREYELANAYRGAATDGNEVAGEQVALSALHGEKAKAATGEDKAQEQAASDAYLEDAKETTPDLTKALGVLRLVGVGTSINSYLPPQLQKMLDPMGTLRNETLGRLKLPGGLGRVPGLGGLPGLGGFGR